MNGSFNRSVNAFRIRYLAPLTRNLSRAWRWWLAELSELLPENLRQLVSTASQRLIVSTDGDDFVVQYDSEGSLREIGRISSAAENRPAFSIPDDARQCSLLLPPDQVLIRALTLPFAAEENLREVLSFEMDRQTPFTTDQVYYDFVITERSAAGKTLSLRLFVVPRQIVDDALTRLAAAGIQPDVIATHALDGRVDASINLLPEDHRSKRGTILHWANAALAALAILLITTAIALPLIQKNQMIRLLETDVQAATVAAQASIHLRQEVEKLVDGSRYLVRKKQTELTMVHLLDEISGVIPDHTWVNRIDIAAGEISLQGQSAAAAGLIASIEASPTFRNARFRSPVTQIVRTDQERFHLSAEISPGPDE